MFLKDSVFSLNELITIIIRIIFKYLFLIHVNVNCNTIYKNLYILKRMCIIIVQLILKFLRLLIIK